MDKNIRDNSRPKCADYSRYRGHAGGADPGLKNDDTVCLKLLYDMTWDIDEKNMFYVFLLKFKKHVFYVFYFSMFFALF